MSIEAPTLSTPFLSDLLWLLTTGTETRRSAPHPVPLGVAAAAVHDLEQVGEVTWSGRSDAASLSVRATCRCEDDTLRRWHDVLRDRAHGAALPARFALHPLARHAWLDVALRLTESQTVATPAVRDLGGKTAFAVRDPQGVTQARADLTRALEHGTVDDRQHELVAVAWATGCFDDLFHPHGWEAAPRLLDAARREVEEDATYARISAACAFSGAIWDTGLTR